jgi:hypothetical protein
MKSDPKTNAVGSTALVPPSRADENAPSEVRLAHSDDRRLLASMTEALRALNDVSNAYYGASMRNPLARRYVQGVQEWIRLVESRLDKERAQQPESAPEGGASRRNAKGLPSPGRATPNTEKPR